MEDDDQDESRPGAPKELAGPAAGTRLEIARSLADAAPGEMVFVDRHGQTVGRSQVARYRAAFWTSTALGTVAIGLVGSVGFASPLAGVLFGASYILLTLFQLRHWPAERAVLALFASFRWEEAHAALLALEHKRLPAGQRATMQVMLGTVEALLGEPQKALDRLERARPVLARRRRSYEVLRCQAASLRAGAFTTLGRFAEARRARDELIREVAVATGSSRRKQGDYLEMLVQATELTIAAGAGEPETLPDDDTLHRWARAALGRTRFGEILVALAWAFHRRGDDDMARHLLAESQSRIPRPSLHKTSPRLDAWAKDQARAWGIE